MKGGPQVYFVKVARSHFPPNPPEKLQRAAHTKITQQQPDSQTARSHISWQYPFCFNKEGSQQVASRRRSLRFCSPMLPKKLTNIIALSMRNSMHNYIHKLTNMSRGMPARRNVLRMGFSQIKSCEKRSGSVCPRQANNNAKYLQKLWIWKNISLWCGFFGLDFCVY